MSLTYNEILNQPVVWQRTIDDLPAIWKRLCAQIDVTRVDHVLFVGCGTSLYIAQTAAHSFCELTGIPSVAVPASEVFLTPASIIPADRSILAFIISRSGTTSEALLAAEEFKRLGDRVQTIGVTCHADTPLEAATDAAIELAFAAEQSVVMTQSFTTMVLALQLVAAIWSGRDDVANDLAKLPAELLGEFSRFDSFAREYGDASRYALTVF